MVEKLEKGREGGGDKGGFINCGEGEGQRRLGDSTGAV